MTHGHLQGWGPYAELPSYFGGLFPLGLALADLLGSAELGLSIASWFEPALWLTAAWLLGRALWPQRTWPPFVFAFLLSASAGRLTNRDDIWVNAPNLAGQMMWPIFPRDLAIILGMVALSFAIKGQWVRAGLLSGVGVCIQAQVGALNTALVVLALLVGSKGRAGWWPGLAAGVVASAVSAVWWVPRVAWTLRFGIDLANSESWVELPISLKSLSAAYGLLLVPAAVGIGQLIRHRRSQGERLIGIWLALSVAALLATVWIPDAILAVRRTLVLGTMPLAAAGAMGLERIWGSSSLRNVRLRRFAAVALALSVAVASTPTLLATRAIARDRYDADVYRRLAYDNSEWQPIWDRISRTRGLVAVPPGDATVAWVRSGRPQLYVPRPGWIKAGFTIERATGWGERSREEAVTAAYLSGPSALCRLSRQRNVELIAVRARKGQLGLLDFVPEQTGEPLPRTFVRADHRRSIVESRVVGVRRVSIWIASDAAETDAGELRGAIRLRLGDAGWVMARDANVDGISVRLDFVLPRDARTVGRLELENRWHARIPVIRAVGYVPSSVGMAPATLVRPSQLC